MSDNEIAISVKNLSKSFRLPHEKQGSIKNIFVGLFKGKTRYEKQKVLKDISFDIKKGEFFGIVGRNGSGKSTLLKLLAGVYSPNEGMITINGKLTPFIELGVGFNPELTGRENVFLNGALLGFDRNEMNAMYDEIVEFAELEKFMDQKLKNYSSGMQVRLAFSIAIRADTEILVLDEVLAVGDANFQEKCFEYFRKLKKNNKTVVLVSHDMDSVKKFSDKAMLIDAGKISLIGTPEEVSDEYIRKNIEKERASSSNREIDNEFRRVKITSVNLLHTNYRPLDGLIKGGANIRVEVKYQVNEKLENINIGLGLHSSKNGYVFGYNTQMDNFIIDQKLETLTLELQNLSLLEGRYYFNVVCFGEDEVVPYDYHERITEFTVQNEGTSKRYRGIVNFPHKWESHKTQIRT